jgi:hypothetical protein
MGAVRRLETPGSYDQLTQLHIPEQYNPQINSYDGPNTNTDLFKLSILGPGQLITN